MELPFSDPDAPPALPEGMFLRPGVVDFLGQQRLQAALETVLRAVPPARIRTKGGGLTAAAMTNCGVVGWWGDAKGYRYISASPQTGLPWPPIPDEFIKLIQGVTSESPWPDFAPDACLINAYAAGAKMGLHQDRNEKDFSQPIITVSLGDAADFLIGGFARGDKTQALKLRSGDVLLMGGASRMRFHGVRKIYPGTSPLDEISGRYSLTFRKAL